MYDVAALGELLIDFTPSGVSKAGNSLFERNPGGAPANVLTALSKLGGKSAFIGMVGDDQFGRFLKDVLVQNGIESRGLRFSKTVGTTLAFVTLDAKGDREFSFYRNPGADIMLTDEDVDYGLIDDASIFHFGSLSLTDEPSKSATISALEYARKAGKLISYDPNWRPPLWRSKTAARDGMTIGLRYADVLKLSKEELKFLLGTVTIEEGGKMLFDRGAGLVVVTLGEDGCYYRYANGEGYLKTYDADVIDTTGAGDAFLGGLLYMISKDGRKLREIERRQMERYLDFSNAVGALCTTKKGAIPAMPSIEEVKEFISKTAKLR